MPIFGIGVSMRTLARPLPSVPIGPAAVTLQPYVVPTPTSAAATGSLALTTAGGPIHFIEYTHTNGVQAFTLKLTGKDANNYIYGTIGGGNNGLESAWVKIGGNDNYAFLGNVGFETPNGCTVRAYVTSDGLKVRFAVSTDSRATYVDAAEFAIPAALQGGTLVGMSGQGPNINGIRYGLTAVPLKLYNIGYYQSSLNPLVQINYTTASGSPAPTYRAKLVSQDGTTDLTGWANCTPVATTGAGQADLYVPLTPPSSVRGFKYRVLIEQTNAASGTPSGYLSLLYAAPATLGANASAAGDDVSPPRYYNAILNGNIDTSGTTTTFDSDGNVTATDTANVGWRFSRPLVAGRQSLTFASRAGGDPATFNPSLDQNGGITMTNIVRVSSTEIQFDVPSVDWNQSAFGVLHMGMTGSIPVKNLDIRPVGVSKTTRFYPEFLSMVGSFYGPHRFGPDWMNTNNNGNLHPTLAQRKPRTHMRQFLLDDGVCWEDMVEVLNTCRTGGKSGWVNIPVGAADDYITGLANYFHTNLLTGNKIYVELVGNEPYVYLGPNSTTVQLRAYGAASGRWPGVTDQTLLFQKEQAYQIKRVGALLRAAVPDASRLIRVANFVDGRSAVQNDLVPFSVTASDFEVAAMHGYFSDTGRTAASAAEFDQMLRTGTNGIQNRLAQMRTARDEFLNFGVKPACYEGGMEIQGNSLANLNYQQYLDYMRSTTWRDTAMTMVTAWEQEFGGPFVWYGDRSRVGGYSVYQGYGGNQPLGDAYTARSAYLGA